MGRMHRLTKSYDPKNLKSKRAHWTEDDNICKSRDYLPKTETKVADNLDEWMDALARKSPTADTYGLIHD